MLGRVDRDPGWNRADLQPLIRTMAFVWDEVFAAEYPPDPEVFLHPDDWDALGRPAEYMGAPVKRSIGVVRGSMRVFDRKRLKYLPEARPGALP